MLTKDGQIKVIDFGTARKLGHTNLARTCIGTPLFVAPEKNGGAYDAKAADVWEAGMTLYFLLVNPPKPMWAKDRRAVMWKNSKAKALSHECKSLLSSMLATNPRSRMSMEQILSCPWFR